MMKCGRCSFVRFKTVRLRTSSYVYNWNNNRRLKNESPLCHVESEEWLPNEVEYVSLACFTDLGVSFYE
ncbi:hypothetical protein TNCT_425761 [Trichonephila clavata]|uniref:Uncharacterized protein n=1 Tax=Trichonephila clavata TaxID=2740835 RepID=A0A8X6J1N9_TRICU|nr:hypothetical protein TNCT_425761 [Trichonephila clavata]